MADLILDGVSTAVAAAVAGATVRQIKYWDSTGLVPAMYSPGRQGIGRKWSLSNLVQLRTVATLRESSVSLQACRKVAEYLQAQGESLASRKLLVRDGDNPDVLTLEGEEMAVSMLEKPGQTVPRVCLIDMPKRIAEVQERLSEALVEDKQRGAA